MLDDHAAIDSRVWQRLPNINALFIEKGIAFDNYWGNFALCCPGRASVLTGQEAHHHGVIKNSASLFDPRVSLATELQAAGYHTMIAGKYFNATSGLADKTPPGWSDVAIKDEGAYFDYPAWINGRKEYHARLVTDYSTDVMADHSLRLLSNVAADKPLFAFLTPNATHGGWDEKGTKVGGQPVAAPRHRGDARCSSIPPWKPASYNEADVSDKPYYIRTLGLVKQSAGHPLQRVCESLLSVDEWLGRFVSELEDQGRLANTLFILTADNGMGWGTHRWTGKVAPHTDQMPLLASWQAVIGNVASRDRTLISNIDIAPTLCEIAGCTMGPFPNGYGVDGESFAGRIKPDLPSSAPSRNAIIVEGGGGKVPAFRAIMTGSNHPLGEWFFIRYPETRERELYDTSGGHCATWQSGEPGDPCMMVNVASAQSTASIRSSLRAQLDSMW